MSSSTTGHGEWPISTDTYPAGAVRVAGWGDGIAFRVRGWAQRWEPYTSLQVDEETGKEIEVECDGEGEWADDIGGKVIVRMVGDDRDFTVDLEDVEPIEEDAYCAECGQIGCCADGRDRSEPE